MEAGGLAVDLAGGVAEQWTVGGGVAGLGVAEGEGDAVVVDAVADGEGEVVALLVAAEPLRVAGVVGAVLQAEVDLPGVPAAAVVEELAAVLAILVACAGVVALFAIAAEAEIAGFGGECGGDLVEQAAVLAGVGGVVADLDAGVFEAAAELAVPEGVVVGEVEGVEFLPGGGEPVAAAVEVLGAELDEAAAEGVGGGEQEVAFEGVAGLAAFFAFEFELDVAAG